MPTVLEGVVVSVDAAEEPRDTHPCDTRVIHEDDAYPQVTVSDEIAAHVADWWTTMRSRWPFTELVPTPDEVLWAATRPLATPLRAGAAVAYAAITVLLVLLAHAASR